LWGIGSKLLKWTVVERKKKEGKLGACLLASHLGKEECVKTYKMKLRWCDNQGHLINKSHSQVKQCKWLVQMKLILSHEIALNITFTND
jgi:hypothetical protein